MTDTPEPVAIPAAAEDVTATFERSLTADEVRVVPKWLGQAWTVLKAEVPTLEGRIRASTIDPELAKQVLVAMVERKLRNPDGLRSFAVDDGTSTIDQALSSGQLEPTAAELARLSPRAVGAAAGGGIFSIPVTR